MSFSYLRSLLITDPAVILCTIVMGSVSVASSVFDRNGVVQDRIARLWARLLLGLCFIRVRVPGKERLDLNRPYVFVGNHLSLMDTPVVLANIPVRFLFMANEKYFRYPFLGTHLRRSGHLAVDSDDVRGSLKVMSEAARTISEKGWSILLFPEGARSKDGRFGEFKEGAAYIAIKAGVPVVPMALVGTREVLAVGSHHIRGGRVELRLGTPIPTTGLSLKDRGALTQLMHDRVAELLADAAAATPGNPQSGLSDQTPRYSPRPSQSSTAR